MLLLLLLPLLSVSSASQTNNTRPLVGCKLNPYYRPVCGNNHQTYPNADLLHCYNRNNLRGGPSEFHSPRQLNWATFIFTFPNLPSRQ